ncbi:cyclin-H [Neocloeon triangulifer]|uniref:cyclin-H n=1 Tax=Neocloeon triangulifer TaxID=2078957 RepID=UPI00286EE818|nr:cyclin-H [Neocloeon triangulifer]
MFTTSTQKKFWLYADESELLKARCEANAKFIEKHGAHMKEEERSEFFLSANDEKILLRQYELQLRDFCRRFEPIMPKSVAGTAFHYFKRFYLIHSVMDYHPKEILVTCVYLACKVDEFNVSINQFVSNVRGNQSKAMDIILNNELLLMQVLNYNLTIHNPFRPIEGLLIDIKTRSQMVNPERLRPGIEDFLDKAFLTSAPLLVAPSQLALAAILHSASKIGENLDNYVTQTLLGSSGTERLTSLVEAVRKVRSMIKSMETTPKEIIRALEKRLEKCRNQENNPDSEIYKQKQHQALQEEDEMYGANYPTMGVGVDLKFGDEDFYASELSRSVSSP